MGSFILHLQYSESPYLPCLQAKPSTLWVRRKLCIFQVHQDWRSRISTYFPFEEPTFPLLGGIQWQITTFICLHLQPTCNSLTYTTRRSQLWPYLQVWQDIALLCASHPQPCTHSSRLIARCLTLEHFQKPIHQDNPQRSKLKRNRNPLQQRQKSAHGNAAPGDDQQAKIILGALQCKNWWLGSLALRIPWKMMSL